jgi:hypothetical protein
MQEQMSQPMPGQLPPNMQGPMPPMSDSQQQANAMAVAQQEAERQASQQQFMSRQFVDINHPSQEVPMKDPRGMPMGPPPQMMMQPRPMPPQQRMEPPQVQENMSTYGFLKENMKMVALVFFLILLSQMEGMQSLIRRFLTYTPLPENFIFTGSKVVVALVGAILFVILLNYMDL